MKGTLRAYLNLIQALNNNDRPLDWDNTVKRVVQLCDAINRAVEYECRGTRHSAYTAIKNQLDGYQTRKKLITGLSYNVVTISSGNVAYRMRKVALEEQNGLKRIDMFHIPLDKRGLVQTQRYSVPGYPCLYLAHTVYGCWEEMGRPDFGTVMVSRFVSQEEFKLLDLRIPSKERWDSNFEMYIKFFPFIIASMVKVNNVTDSYKPEYLILQLLTEWIISHNWQSRNIKERIAGIVYTSAQKNTDFDYPESSYDNYAIPVIKPLSSGKYCKDLTSMYKLTMPTYYDLEELRQGPVIDVVQHELEVRDQREYNMFVSRFGMMQRFLERKPVASINEE